MGMKNINLQGGDSYPGRLAGIKGGRVEAGLTTSTVALRVAGASEKGSLESETVKYGRESEGNRTLE
jgi:hypothetical protein